MLYRLFLPILLLLSTPAPAQGVVSAADPRAAEAGREMLRAGGSATDAALAMMLALTVVEPQSSGIGGGGFLLHQDAATGLLQTIDGRETAPAAADPRRFLTPDGKPMAYVDAMPGGLSVGVPGNIRLMELAHRKWGKLPWPRLFEPAIKLADEGFIVSPRLAAMIAQQHPLWKDFPAIRALYADAEGRPLTAGAKVRNRDLAATFRALAAQGPNAFYSGPIASGIVTAVGSAGRNPAVLTMVDLGSYKVRELPPVCGQYRRFKICGMGPPSSGATTVLQILGMLERFDLKAMGPRDPRAWHLIAEAMKLAYADRDTWIGDRDFVEVPVIGLIDPAYLRARSALISPDRPLGKYEPGNPPGAAARTRTPASEIPGTSHFAAVDRNGNIANMTSTIEDLFGSQLLAGGFMLNNELTDFSFMPERKGVPVANRVEPGKRPLSSMSPTILYDEQGRALLALGSAGGRRIIMHVAKTLIGYIDFGLTAADAIALPNIFFGGDATLVEQGTFLTKMPQLVRYNGLLVTSPLPSKVNAIERVGDGWRGAADPRSDGVALAE